MTLSELKIELIQKIIAIDDLNLLMKINDLLDSYITDQSVENLSTVNETASSYENKSVLIDDEVYIFNPEQRKRVLNSLQQSKDGNFMTEEEAESDIQKWL